MLKILTAPHPVLTTPATPIEKIDRKIKRLVVDMEEALVNHRDPQGVGLAAPQVGVSLALFIIKPNPSVETKVFINPKVRSITGDPQKKTKKNVKAPDEEKMEGCLSVPRIWAALKRPRKAQIEYQDLAGEKKIEWFSGLEAVIVQHEVDHLQGILFTQKCLEQKVPLYEEHGDKLERVKA